VKNGVKNMQTAGYDGARTVYTLAATKYNKTPSKVAKLRNFLVLP